MPRGTEATLEAPTPVARRPPPEVVLPAAYYGILVLEVGALVGLHFARPEESGGQPISYALGWAGTASMLVMHVYSLRKRVKAMRGLGRIKTWLQFHIFCGLQGAILVTYHSLHLHSAASVQAANILMVAIVVLSGIVGRYLYAMIPKSMAGDRLTAEQIEKEMGELSAAVGTGPTQEMAAAAEDYHREYKPLVKDGSTLGPFQLIREDIRTRRALSRYMAELKRRSTQLLLAHQSSADRERVMRWLSLARRRALLSRRLSTLATGERVFRAWTIFHKPLTFILLGATILHVLGHYMFAAGMSG